MVIHGILGVDILIVLGLLVFLFGLLGGEWLLRLLLIHLVLLLLLSLRIIVARRLGIASFTTGNLHQLLCKVVKIALILVVFGGCKVVPPFDAGGGLGR